MAGLIESPEYTSAKKRLCADHDGAERALDAIEWWLLGCQKFDDFELVIETPRGAVRVCVLPETPTTPRVAVVFGFEDHHGDNKVLLLDAQIEQPEETG